VASGCGTSFVPFGALLVLEVADLLADHARLHVVVEDPATGPDTKPPGIK
jgi:hypothetical protein